MKTFTQGMKDFQKNLRHSLIMLRGDPHFQEFVQVMREGRDSFWRQASGVGVSQKDQDKCLGAASALDQTVSQIELIINQANGRLNAGFDSDEQSIDRG